ncbi:conserved hypothetical protein [Culex quinquefasciatus]|uniref:Uncharacterized protein n=1 Tax=Culex quinquefasciatus TaxID=7176 RepID=B0WU94_CULQU|nr:conserved hypothetical protein [Culex quinquefasciatus]|eukprot:XP_001858165.1 conserved hypothetical protein [Culex quinquefasciatus]
MSMTTTLDVPNDDDIGFRDPRSRTGSLNASTDNIQKESTLRSVSTETDTLRKQVATLKRSHDNAVAENGRLSNDLSDAGSELTLTKRKLADCQQEVERMKSQLREYVQEIQRAEELLCVKEREREEMLEHYKSLSEGVNMLEVSNQTLEVESAEAKKLLQEAEGRINGLQEQVGLRQSEIKTYERQINELSANIVALESEVDCLKEENQHLREDLEATKDLCNKLDLQKDKLNEELNEHSSIREQLNRENATLKRQLTLATTGDKAAVDGLQELLAASRSEVEQQRIVTSQLNQEVKSLKEQVSDLSRKLEQERDRATRSEATASEYSVQLQELRRMITDDRFAQVQSREEDDYNRIKSYLNAVQKSFSTLSSAVSVVSSKFDPQVSESPQVNSCHSEKDELDIQVSEKSDAGYPHWMLEASGMMYTESETGRLMRQYLAPSDDQNQLVPIPSSDIEVLLDKNQIVLSDERSGCDRNTQVDSEIQERRKSPQNVVQDRRFSSERKDSISKIKSPDKNVDLQNAKETPSSKPARRHSSIEPGIVQPGEPNTNLESTVLEGSEEKSLNGQAKPPERGYQEFRKSLIRNSHKKASSLSVPASSTERKPSQTTSAADDDEKPQKPKTGGGGSKIDERGSTVVIYKNALGERLIVAEGGGQRQNRPPTPAHEESDYKTAAAWDSSSSESSVCSSILMNCPRDGASDARTTAIVTQRIQASLKPSLVLKCDPKTYVLNLKIKVPRDSDGKTQEQQSGISGSKK